MIDKIDDISDLLTDMSSKPALPMKRPREEAKQVPIKRTEERKVNSPVEKQMLWVDKYAPKTQNDIIGNKGAITNYEVWLRDWDDVILKGHKKAIDFRKKDPPKLNAKACIISGAPGIGKTSAVRIIGKKLGFHILELNASDARGKLKIEELLKDCSKTQSITTVFNTESQQQATTHQQVQTSKGRNLFRDGLSSA